MHQCACQTIHVRHDSIQATGCLLLCSQPCSQWKRAESGSEDVKTIKFGKEGNVGEFNIGDKVAADDAALTITLVKLKRNLSFCPGTIRKVP